MWYQQNRKKCAYHKYLYYDYSNPSVKYCFCGKRQDEDEPKENKYHARQSEYDGIVYHSQKEADYAAELDLRKKAGDVERWERQVKISLDANGHHICNYYVDFKVYPKVGKIQLVEVKGFETEIYRLKRKLVEAIYLPQHPDEEYLVVK